MLIVIVQKYKGCRFIHVKNVFKYIFYVRIPSISMDFWMSLVEYYSDRSDEVFDRYDVGGGVPCLHT